MNYKEAIEFHKKSKVYGSILGLDTIRNLMHELNDVWKELQIVHIAGTNGKGSVCCFLASVLKEAGYRVGQFNSPAVFDMREVYRINGEMISEEEYANCMEAVASACDAMVEKGLAHPTVFEIETAIAFLWFYQKSCDIVLLEVGMGGSTDATNLIEKPLCSVLTSISMDHMDFLGNTLEEIAKVKAGIIKENCPVVSAKQQPEVMAALKEQSLEKNADLYVVAEYLDESVKLQDSSLCYMYPGFGYIELGMNGNYQIANSALAIEVLACLRRKGYSISDEVIFKGLKQAKWKGRFECISKKPYFIMDGAHNTDAAMQLKESLRKQFSNKKKIGIMGVMADKPYREMLDILLPEFDRIYTVTPDNPRALAASKLAEVISEITQKEHESVGVASNSVGQAVQMAVEEAEKDLSNTVIVAFGSLYYLAEVKKAIKILK